MENLGFTGKPFQPSSIFLGGAFTIHKTYFKNGPNKLECYIATGWKGLPGTNTLAYYACTPVAETEDQKHF